MTKTDQPQPLWKFIERRHEGTGWQVFYEVPNSTGAARRRADAVAVGLWPSTKHEIHGYEFKESRQDTRRELEDISKHDAVGCYCDYWWLVVRDEKMIDGLMIPSQWGILVPRGGVLRQQRKAAKRKAKPIDRPFFAALARCVSDGWVPKTKYDEIALARVEYTEAEIAKAVERERERLVRHNHEALAAIKAFRDVTGVDIMERGHYLNAGRIGEAVKVVMELQDAQKHLEWRQRELERLEAFIATLTSAHLRASELVANLRQTPPVHRQDESPQPGVSAGLATTRFYCDSCECTWARTDGTMADRCPRCARGMYTATVDQGGPRDSGVPGASEQDAGVQLRDQREAVQDGQQASPGPGIGV